MKALPDHIFASVIERDIDLLILEELRSSARFREWWLRQVGYDSGKGHELQGAWHSLSEAGESDVVFLVSNDDGQRCAIMIEDKIYAPAQPDQARRYHMRGANGVAEGVWDRYIVCITASTWYLEASSEAHLYDARVSHEAIRSWFEASDLTGERARHKVALLTAAIERSRRGYVKVAIPGVSSFLRGYWEIATAEFPELAMPEPREGGSRSQWVRFASPAPGRTLVHKLTSGYVDLELRSQAANLDELASDNSEILDGSLQLRRANRSAAFRVAVRRIDHFGTAADQLDEIREGLSAARRLLTLSPDIRVR